MKMSAAAKFNIIKNIEPNIDLVMTDDEIIPYNLAITIGKEPDMECEPPSTYIVPSNESGEEGIEVARRIRLGIYKKVYPDTWEIRHINPEDRFAKGQPISETSAGYHYVRFKAPNKVKKLPCFEARVYNPISKRMTVIGSFYFGGAYSGESVETAFYKACVAVDEFYGNVEKSFRTYLKYLNKDAVDKDSYEKETANEKEELQKIRRVEYLRKYLTNIMPDDKHKSVKSSPKKNLFMRKSEDEFSDLTGFYPYVYIYKKGERWILSSSVPDFEEHEKCTLGTFYIDEKSFKSTWIQLAKLVDGHFKRPIKDDSYYDNLAPTFKQLIKA
tara:strand:+ start:1239 stop:2225 length:987 start_codon:yes stop_codon:yes gene_type:complete